MKPKYPGTTEVVPGVFIDFSADPAVYIADDKGEIVMWNWLEVVQDPGAWTASLMAVIVAAKLGTEAEREVIDSHGDPFKMLESQEQKTEPAGWNLVDFLIEVVGLSTRAYARRLIHMDAIKVNGTKSRGIRHQLDVGDVVEVPGHPPLQVTFKGS